MKIEKYKPKFHKNGCEEEDCELDCNMECSICGTSPDETNFYYIIEGRSENFQMCEKCFNELKISLINPEYDDEEKKKEWLEKYKQCRACFYTLARTKSRSGNQYYICSKCGAVYKLNGKRDYVHTKWGQDDFT